MNRTMTRRRFAVGVGTAGLAAGFAAPMAWAVPGGRLQSPFRLSVIADEISEDFEHACDVAANEFQLSWIEIREAWGKNSIDLSDAQLAEVGRILTKYQLRVTDFASPLFKVDWKGAPLSKFSPKHDSFGSSKGFDDQPAVLERCIKVAKAYGTDKIRCFDFWRLEDQKPYRAAIDAMLNDAADRVGKEGMMLVLENEPACNTGTGAEAGTLLRSVKNANFKLNWDPANAGMIGVAKPYPDDFEHIPFDRIAHCHCKDVGAKAGGGYEWLPVGKGIMDWVGQFRALKKGGYTMGVSMETHWKGGGTPEASTRVSIAGMFDALRKADCLTS